jgi:hypothetical protein
MDVRFEAFMANNYVKFSQAISHIIVELKINISEIFSVYIIRVDDGDQGHG